MNGTIHGVGKFTIKGDEVTDNDVLCGRGHRSQHLGNVQFLQLVSRKKDSYTKAKSGDRKAIVEQVVQAVFMKDGRFIEKHPSEEMYREITLSSALLKAMETFKALSRKQCKHTGCSKRSHYHGLCRAHGGNKK